MAGIFTNPLNTAPANNTNIFGNAVAPTTFNNLGTGATNTNLFGSPAANTFQNNTFQQPTNNNLFTNQQQQQQNTTPNPFNQQQVGSTAPTNMFGGTATASSAGGLFSQPQSTPNQSFFNPVGQAIQPANNIFSQPTTNQPYMNNTATTFNPQQQQQQQQLQPQLQQQQQSYDPSTITNFKKGSLVRVTDDLLSPLSNANSFLNSSARSLNSEIIKRVILPVIKSIDEAEKNCDTIQSKNRELFSLMESYNSIMRERLTLLKKIFLEIVEKSNLIRQLSTTLDRCQKLAQSEFDTFYQSISGGNRYGCSVLSPSEFEMELSSFVLKKARDLLQQLNEYQGCQDTTEEVSYIEVVPPLIEYYKNVACLMNEFREKYEKFKQMLARRSRGSGYDLQARLDNAKNSELTRNTATYIAIVEAEKLLKVKIKHCEEVRNRSQLQLHQ